MPKADQNGASTEVAALPANAVGIIESLDIRFTDTETIQWRIAERLATATTLEELLDQGGPLGLREHIGEDFSIQGVDYLKSSFPGMPVFALISAVNRDGEPVTYTTGALSVVIQLARGMKMGWWTGEWVKARYSTDEPTAEGNRPYMLTKA